MTEPALTSLPDQLFVLDRGHNAHEFLDMLLTFCTFGGSAGLLLVGPGVEALALAHRGIPLPQFGTMGLQGLMVDSKAAEEREIAVPESATAVDASQIRTLYEQVPRILHP
ncbi:hypothetical protein ACMDCT_03040 [Halomonadaceae bacterium KBTZ08]